MSYRRTLQPPSSPARRAATMRSCTLLKLQAQCTPRIHNDPRIQGITIHQIDVTQSCPNGRSPLDRINSAICSNRSTAPRVRSFPESPTPSCSDAFHDAQRTFRRYNSSEFQSSRRKQRREFLFRAFTASDDQHLYIEQFPPAWVVPC